MRPLALALTATLLAAGCGDAAAPATTAAPPVTAPAAGWRELPPGPLSLREQALALWAGDELLVIGGSDAPPCPPGADCVTPDFPALADGAALDPATGEWRAIAEAPLPVWQASGVVAGGTVYAWLDGIGTRPGTERAFLAYHPAEDRWERLPLPDPGPQFGTLAAAGDDVILYQPTQEWGATGDLRYDPAAGTWEPLPADPLQPAYDRDLVWTGTELVLLGIRLDTLDGGGPNVYSAAVYDPAAGAWQRLPDSEIIGHNPAWHWAAGWVVNATTGSSDGGAVNNFGRPYPHGGVLDPASGAWGPPLPEPPEHTAGLTGYDAATATRALNIHGLLLDAEALTWAVVPEPPGGTPSLAAVAWAGDDLVVWGGVDMGDPAALEHVATGWAWRPAR